MATPAHVAIIMDGNGRWAKARGLPRLAGHRAGVEALRKTVRAAPGLGISFLTVYAFSSENWSRPKSEVSDLMGLLKLFIRRDLAELHQSGVLTRHNTPVTWVMAVNLGGRDGILRTARKLAQAVARGEIDSEAITAESFAGCLDTQGIPDPELVIRTSGELRLSNFLLWQAAYSELVFLPCYWPDFSHEHLAEALRDFASRERRFGGLGSQDVASRPAAG